MRSRYECNIDCNELRLHVKHVKHESVGHFEEHWDWIDLGALEGTGKAWRSSGMYEYT